MKINESDRSKLLIFQCGPVPNDTRTGTGPQTRGCRSTNISYTIYIHILIDIYWCITYTIWYIYGINMYSLLELWQLCICLFKWRAKCGHADLFLSRSWKMIINIFFKRLYSLFLFSELHTQTEEQIKFSWEKHQSFQLGWKPGHGRQCKTDVTVLSVCFRPNCSCLINCTGHVSVLLNVIVHLSLMCQCHFLLERMMKYRLTPSCLCAPSHIFIVMTWKRASLNTPECCPPAHPYSPIALFKQMATSMKTEPYELRGICFRTRSH